MNYRLLAAICVLGLAACGGGAAVSPTLPTTQTQLDNLNAKYDTNSNQSTSDAVKGSSTESIKSIFMDELKTGAKEIIADIGTYYQKSIFLKNPIQTDTATNLNGSTTITVHHSAHGLHVGDKVSVKNLSQDINGIASASLTKNNTITAVKDDTYQLIIQGSASITGYGNVDASFSYQIKECTGKYNSLESALSETIYKNKMENLEVYYSTSTVVQKMRGCAPEDYGPSVTNKYYKKIADGYELVAQNVGDGDYSTVYGVWLLPSEGLSSTGDKLSGEIGKLINYANTLKLQNNGYTLVSYSIAPDTSNSVFLIITLKNYSSSDLLMTTELNIYGKSKTGYQLVKRQIDYKNPAQTRVEISNFVTPPDIEIFATKNGFSPEKAAEIKLKCEKNLLLFLNCAREYMPMANVID
jgi:hypothetical protein